jgi:hypothetical protein
VKINIMDRDGRGIRSLMIKRGDKVIEEIKQPGKGVVERSFDTCGDYTAHCVMKGGSLSQSCEFAVSELDFSLPAKNVPRSKSWDIELTSGNMNAIIIYFKNSADGSDEHNVFITAEDRKAGKVTIPASVIQRASKMQVWLVGENRYGRLKKRRDIQVTD